MGEHAFGNIRLVETVNILNPTRRKGKKRKEKKKLILQEKEKKEKNANLSCVISAWPMVGARVLLYRACAVDAP